MQSIPFARVCLDAARQTALWHLVQNMFQFEPSNWTKLAFNGVDYGYLNHDWRERVLADWSGRYEVDAQRINLLQPDYLALADALQHMARQWCARGLLTGWRDELFDVHNAAGQAIFALERAAFRPLGLASHAVHINGLFVSTTGETRFWIARRSPQKSVDPNKLDNMVGGGISSGESVVTALVREAFEEAGLPEKMLRDLPQHSLQYGQRKVANGVHREYLHIFDLLLPEEVLPQNQDGEVAGFQLMTPNQVVDAALAKDFMNDALLATLDMLWRLGYISADAPLANWLKNSQQSETK